MAKGDVITEWKITPNWVCRYTFIDGEIPENCRPTQNKVKGELSLKAIRRIKAAVNWLVYLSKEKRIYMKQENKHFKFKINFITLTLSSPQQHSDRVIKAKLLQPFIRILRSKYKVTNYVWKAETQRNGNIHFHITCDVFIHYKEIRDTWNTIQETLGYVTRSNIVDPNSTDIHSVLKVTNLAAYLSKYIAKNDPTRRKIEGKIWDCNKELKSIIIKSRRDDVMRLVAKQILNQGGTTISDKHQDIYFMKSGTINNLCITKQMNKLLAAHYSTPSVASLPRE